MIYLHYSSLLNDVFVLSQAEHGEAETERYHSEKEKLPAEQPFIQAPHRQSVIVFSSGQKLLPRNGASIQTSQHAAQLQPFADQTSRSQSELNSRTDRTASPGKQCKTKGKVTLGELSTIRYVLLLCVNIYGFCCSFQPQLGRVYSETPSATSGGDVSG